MLLLLRASPPRSGVLGKEETDTAEDYRDEGGRSEGAPKDDVEIGGGGGRGLGVAQVGAGAQRLGANLEAREDRRGPTAAPAFHFCGVF